ncbi:MAG: endolytic transglycosylase MltG [Thermoanaerobaculaceae bacterium]|nr:endolytic transglycosylase MltG [Thermoanaerobaculaceae bacterium]
MKKFSWLLPVFISSVFVISMLFLSISRDFHTKYKGFEGEKYFTIQKGESSGRILERLFVEKIVEKSYPIKIAYALSFKKKSLKAGVYLFDKPLSPKEVLSKLEKGEVALLKLTLREGLTIEEYSKELANATGSFEGFLSAMKDPSLIKEIDPQAKSLEGYLLPDTYFVAPFTSEKEIVKIVVQSFLSFWNKVEKEHTGADLRKTIILASIVEKETADSSEKSRIAGVFLNRLKIGMALQSDPTTVYALNKRGLYRGYLTKEDLKFEDPFNTYTNLGLPPEPICSPSKETILAVLNPEKHHYLYFVSKGDGSHYFSETLNFHNQAVSKYIKNGRKEK